jgi:hypothetical protein
LWASIFDVRWITLRLRSGQAPPREAGLDAGQPFGCA